MSGSRVLPAPDLLTGSHGTLRSTASGFRSCGSPGSRNEEAGVLWSLRVLRWGSGFRGHQVGNLCHLWRHLSEQGAPEPLGTGSVGAPELLSLWGLGAWWPVGACSQGPWGQTVWEPTPGGPVLCNFLAVHPMLGAQLTPFSWHSGSSGPGVVSDLEGSPGAGVGAVCAHLKQSLSAGAIWAVCSPGSRISQGLLAPLLGWCFA